MGWLSTVAIFLDDRATLVGDFAHHVGLHAIAAVDHRADRVEQLQRRDRHRLAEADARQIHALDLFLGNEDAAGLAGNVHAGLRADAEGLEIVVESLGSQPQAHLHKDGIAGVLQRLCEGLRAVGLAPAAHAASVHVGGTRAVKSLARGNHAAVQRRRRGENFERRARLVGVGEHAIAHKLGQRRNVAARRIVQIEVRLVHHGQNFARPGIHGQNAHGFGAIDRQRFPRRLLAEALNGRVDGQPDAAAIHRGHIFAGAIVQRTALAVDLVEDSPALSGQIAVQRALQSRLTHAVDGRQPDQLGRERAHGIVSLALLFQIQSV